MRTHHRVLTMGLTLVLAFGLAGCSAPAVPPATETASAIVTTPATEAATPPEIAAAFDEFGQAAAELGVPGAFILVRTDEGEFTYSYGTTSLGSDTPPTADTMFRIGSNTKTFTGTIILQLVDEGMVQLDDPASKYRTDVPRGDEITIEMLLSMRSGLANYTDNPALSEAAESFDVVFTPEQLLEYAFSEDMAFDPGTSWMYSNTNTVLLGLIAEQVTGTSMEQLIAERLTKPLGLTRTWLPEREDVSLEAPFANGYTYMSAEDAEPMDITFANPSWAGAAGAGVHRRGTRGLGGGARGRRFPQLGAPTRTVGFGGPGY